jgi:tetratricopeptide (TPR) repeat protein
VSIYFGYDPVTLRELVDVDAVEQRLAEIGDGRSREVLNEKVGLLRFAGRLDEALDVANAAVREARFGGDRQELLLARIRRAVVLQTMGKIESSVTELSGCADEARTHDWGSAEAFALQHRGKAHFDREEFREALRDFREALTIRSRIKAPEDQIDSAAFAVSVTEARVADLR